MLLLRWTEHASWLVDAQSNAQKEPRAGHVLLLVYLYAYLLLLCTAVVVPPLRCTTVQRLQVWQQRLVLIAAAVAAAMQVAATAAASTRVMFPSVFLRLPSKLVAARIIPGTGTLAGLAWPTEYAILPTTKKSALGVQTDKLLHHWG